MYVVNCSTYNNDSECTKCKSGYNLIDGYCMLGGTVINCTKFNSNERCVECDTNHLCINANGVYKEDNTFCEYCLEEDVYIEYCTTYDQDGYCYGCSFNKVPFDEECIDECSFNIYHCEECDP